MMRSMLYPLVMLLFESWSSRRDAKIRLLKLQVELLRERIPGDRVILAPEERHRLMKIGAELGHRVYDLMEIVTVKTYQRWRREQAQGKVPGHVGRPRKVTASLRALILRLAKENKSWGARRIVGELKKLALPVSRTSVRRVLAEEGILPDPQRHAPRGVVTPWRTFVKAHANVIVATDFFCKTVWTPLGKHVAYGLVFIHLGSRKVLVSPGTYHPNEQWVLQQARNMTMWLEDEGLEIQFLLRDRDTKYSPALDRLVASEGAETIRSPYCSPIANCYAESWICSLKRECLNHFLCFGLKHFDHIVQTYTKYYNRLRPHQGLGNRPLDTQDNPIPIRVPPEVEPVKRHPILGGLLNHYERKAA